MNAWKSLGAMLLLLALVATVLILSCGDDDDDDDNDADGFSLTSSAFGNNEPIPDKYTCHGQDVSPALLWSQAPQGAAAFAITCIDIDAGDTPHWGIVNIAADAVQIAEGAAPTGGAWETLAYTDEVGYAGPCPPQGEVHRYVFTLTALGESIPDPGQNVELADVLAEIDALAIEQTTLIGTYIRTQ